MILKVEIMINLKKIGIEVLKEYAEKLNITLEDAEKIILHNKSAEIFLSGESGLRMRNGEDNLTILLRTTLFREFQDFAPLRNEEIKIIRKYYGICINTIGVSENKVAIKERSNFINDCLEFEAELEDVDEYTNNWINGEYDCDLFEYLGMTEEEYDYWNKNKSSEVLRIIMHCHEYKKEFNKLINEISEDDRMIARARSIEELKIARSKVEEIRKRKYNNE